ncbi:MAG: LTA synthase family protein [SAR324 cluster bacterium]|nr:LTA synthase family protein [SAR324 cluster bacterium]
MNDWIPRRIRFATALIVLNLILYSAFRLIFLAMFAPQSSPVDAGTVLRAFSIGFRFDMRLAVLVVLPVLLLSWLPGLNLLVGRMGRRIWLGYLAAVAVGAVWVFLMDLGHYGYLQSRLNATVLQLLESPMISLEMAWQSYPVVWGGLGLVLFALGYWWLLRRLARWTLDSAGRSPGWWRRGLVIALFTGMLLLGLYGKLAYYPLRWSEAFFTPHPLATALALNPVLYFYDTLKFPEKDFSEEEVRKYYEAVADYLGVRARDAQRLQFDRKVVPSGGLPGDPNVVVIFLESFSAYKVGAFGNPLGATPNFDAVAKRGLLFKNFFVPSTGTARSIFTALFGIPDVTLGSTSSRNPLLVDQDTIITAFKGYDKLYFIGGSANWGNIRGVLAYNIPELRIYEEGDYDAPHNDVWGVSDLRLFGEANKILAARSGKPFFAIIQSAGNHRPYTIPEDNGGYQWLDPQVDNIQRRGFLSVQEFNAFRFLDHSLGHFLRSAEKEPYFQNTVFVIFGDHGVPGFAEHLPSGYGKHQLTQHQVPLLIYAPGLIGKGRIIETVASEMDVLPTVASLLGKPYLNTTLGRDILDPDHNGRQGAFILIPYRNPAPIGFVDREFFFLIDSDGREKLYNYLSGNPEQELQERYPEIAREMSHLTRGIFETARYMLHKNGNRPASR